jgi:hypothetical protein
VNDEGEQVKNAEAHPGMAWVREQWRVVASLAWTGYVDEGRGAVVVEKEEEPLADGLRYIAGPVWNDAASNALIQTYDPRREVVLVIVHGAERTCHRLEALPCPPDAVVTHPVERLRPNDRRDKGPVTIPIADDEIDPLLVNEPLLPGDILVGGPCPFCGSAFEVGDLTRWASAGPVNRREYGKARRGLPYVTRSPWALHYDCGDPKGQLQSVHH